MGFKDWFNDKFGGGGSEDSTSSSTYDIDYEQLDRNDSYSPYQNAKESGQAYKQYQQAYSNYQQAQRNKNDYAGWQMDDLSSANANAAVDQAKQASDAAFKNWQNTINPFFPRTPSYTPTYQNVRDPSAAYDPADWQAAQASGARNSPTDYLAGAERAAEEARRNAQTGNGVYGTPKTSNPFGPATSQTQYYPWERPNLDQTDTRGTDASNPLFPSDKLESSPDTGSRGSIIDRFRKDAETLESMYYNPVKEPQFNFGDMLKNGRNLLFPERTDEQKAAKAELDQAKFEFKHSGGSDREAARERLDKAQAAYDDVTKKLEKEAVTAVDNGTTGTNPKLQELYDSMSPFRRALRRFELATEGGLQLGALATFVTTPLTAATSTLQKLAGDIPTALDIPLAARFAYQVANGKANPVKEGVGVESFTQEQWDDLPDSAKYQLSTIYKITNLDEFNEALKTANDLVRSNDTYKEGMSNLRDEYLFDEKIKAFHDYSQRMVDEAGYGLNKFEQFAIKLIPSGIDMAVDAVFNNWSGLAHAGLGLMADRIFGETYYDDRLAGHDHEHASAHALASAVVEVTSELIGGESVMDTLAYGNKGVFTEGIDAAIAKIGNPLMQAAAKYAAGTGSEILEEEFSQVVSPFVDALLEESPYLQTVIEKYGEQRAQEYVEAALGAILLTGVGNAAGDIATSAANRVGEARGKYEAPNIDGTTTEENPNGKKAYSQTMQQVANINRNRNMDQNQLIQSIYGRAKEAGASDEQAKAVANDVYDMKGKAGKDIYNEFVKFNDGTKTREEIDAAIEAFKPELLEAEEGYVVLDADNKPVGTVKTVNDYGITIQFNDGTTESAILNGVGSGGMLDPNSRLAKVLGDNGTVVDAETADIYSRNAEQERKAQIKAGEEMQDRGEKAQPQTAQPPKADTPAPHKAPTPAKAQPTQQQTTQQQAPQQEQPRNTTGEQRAEQQAPTGPQFQDQDVYDNTKYEVEQSANGYYVKQPDGGLVGPFETYEQAMGMVSQFSQQNPAPRNTAGEQRAEEQAPQAPKAETPIQTQEESQPEATQEQEAPSEPEAPPSRSPLTDSVTEANTVTENNGTPSKAEQYFADNPKKTTYQTTYKEAGVKIKKNADGTFTVSMASPKKNGNGWTKAVSVIGTVNSISEANQLVVDEYSKKSAPKALTDSATGTPIESPQNASQSVSQEEGNSVLPNEQNVSEAQNEELNSKPEREATEHDEIREKRAITQDENDLEGRKDPLMSVTDSDGTSLVWGAEEETIDNIDSANQTYEVGGERFSAEDVQRMNPEDVLYRLTSWAKKLGFKGLRGFSEKLGKAITNITATTSRRGNVETQLIVDDNGAVKRQPDYSNRTNFDRDAYEESQSKENVNRSREDAAYMFLLNQDKDAKVSDVFNGLTSRFDGEKARAAQFILRRIFKNSGLNFETATVKEAADYLAQKAQDTTQQTAENGISDEDLEEIFALLKRSEGLSVKFGNGSYVDLADILNGTAETTTVDDDAFSEADFHGESAYADAIAAIDEDIANIEEQIQDISESQDFGETPDRKYQNIQRLQREIDRLTQRREWLLEQEERIANQADKNSRDTSSEIDMITASEEEAATNRAVEAERDRRPELGSISKDNASFVAAEDVPAAHKGKDATGNFSKVRGIRVDGEMYYALVSEKNGAYKHIVPDRLVEKAQNLFERLRNSIAEKQKTVDYYTAIVSRGETLTAAQEKNLDKTMKTLLALQQKLDKMVNGKYTFRNLWADASIPKDIRSYAVTDEAFRDFSVSSVATAVKESDAINGIRAMKGDSNDRSRTQSYQTDRGRNRLLRGQDTRNGFGADTGRLGTGKRQAGTQASGAERTNALLNRGGTQTSGTGTQTGNRTAAGNSQSVRTENGRQNNVGVSGQSSNAQSARNPITGRDNQTVFSDVSDAWNKSNGNTEDVTRDLISKGYSVTTYRDGKTIVITDKQRPIGTFSNKDGRNTRLNNRLKNNPNFTAYSASKIAVIETDAYGKTTVEMKLGLLAFNRKTGETTLYAANVDSANHELNHDDWSLADGLISDRILNGENIETIDELFHNGLEKALSDIGVDYNALSQYIQSFGYEADEVDEELFAELNAVMYEGSTSDWDGDTSISDIAHKLMQHEEFQNLVAQIRAYADEATQAMQSESTVRYKQDLDQYSDESFDALVNDTSYEEASAINGQNYDQYYLNSEFNAEQASETETLNNMSGRGVDTTAAPIENFQNAEQASENAAMEDLSGAGVDTERTPIDYFQSQEQASESDLIIEQSRNDLTDSEDTNFESPYEAEQRTEQEAMDSLYENMDGRKLTSPKRTANDYYGSAYARVQETQKKHKRNKARSSFSIAELYYKTYGETNDSIRNFKRLQKLNSNVDSLLDGKMSYYDFNSFAKNMSTRQGIGQILNDDIQSELDRVVALEEAAQGKSADDQATKDFQYAAANVVSHIVARMDMVEKTERARARLDTAAKKHGAKGGRKNLVGTALDAWNRYQITGDNFWRMMDDWAGKGQGYSYAREHLKTIATRISEEAKLKGYFDGIDKNSKEFKNFASGTTMSNVDFNGHRISLMEGIKFVKTVDTLRMFASENGRPSWQRVAALGGFTFEGKNGKPIFVDIQGSYDNNAEARAKWVEQRYNQLKQEIANNKAASAYMSAVEEMYYEASKDAEKVHSKVNGYDRYMYGKGWYTDIHYANKNSGTVDFRYSDRDATDVHDTASMQRRTKVAGGYAIINPMSRSVDAYISQISNYIAFEEFGQKLGVLSDSKSINGSYANTIRDAYGDQYAQWFDNYVKSMTLFKDHQPKGAVDTALAKSRQLMMSGALVGSISVPMKQVSSFFDTMGTLDPRAVRRAFITNPLGLKQKGIKNYLMDSRNQSVSSPEFAELFGDTGLLGNLKNNPVVKLARNATSMMDATTVSNVYKAAMYDVEYNNPLGKGIYNNGKNFKDGLTAEGQFYVDAKFEEALLASQPIFTPQARNELARTDDQFKRMFQTFRTQQTQNYNRMLQAVNEYQAAKRNGTDSKAQAKTLRDTIQGQLAASVSLAALTAIATVLQHKHYKYKDDDDEFDKEKFLKRFGLDALESFAGNALFIGDLTKWVIEKANIADDFYGVSAGALSTAVSIGSSAVNLCRKLQEEGWTQANKVEARYLAGNVATAMGIPINNAYTLVNSVWQLYADMAHIDRKYDDIFLQWAYVDDQPQNRLVNAILKEDTNKVEDMFDDMGQDKFQNAVYYGAFDQFKAGKIDKAEYVELLMNFAGKSYKEASNEVEKKSKLLDSGISQYNGIDGRDGRKAFYDRYADNFKSRAEYKQFFADVKEGKADGKHNTYYTQWNGQPQEVSANQSSIIDTLNRNIQAGNFDYATAKLLWENYYGYSTSKYSAWKFVGK